MVGPADVRDHPAECRPVQGVQRDLHAPGLHVDEVDGGTINCPCHGSKFSIEPTARSRPARPPSRLPDQEDQGRAATASSSPDRARRAGGPTPWRRQRTSGRVICQYRATSSLSSCLTRPPTVPRPGTIPGVTGRLPLPRPDRPGDLRRQGEEPAQPAELLLRRHVVAARAHPADGHHRGERRLGHGRHRGRGAPAGVHLDQGVRPAVQRPLPRRQVVPVPRGHPRRGVPAAAGDARRQAQGRALLRAVLARLGHPRDARPAAAGVPGAHLLGRGVQAGRPDRPALPARLHRQVLGAVRRPGRAPTSTGRIVDDFCDFMAGRTDTMVRRLEREMQAGLARSWSSSGRPGCATTSPRCAGRWRSRPWCSATAPTPTWSPSPRTRSRRPCRSSTCATAGSAASAAGWWRRPRT